MFKKSSLFLAAFLWVVLLIPQKAISYGMRATAPQDSSFRDTIHTVQKDETLFEIAQYFDVDLKKIIRLNNLHNPDLIFPGDNLLIEIQDDFSIRVTSPPPVIDEWVPQEMDYQELIAHTRVTYPNKDDIFAPENPIAVFEEKSFISMVPRKNDLGTVQVFQTFLAFIEWLSGDSINHMQINSTGLPQIDPSPSAPYMLSQGIDFTNPLNQNQTLSDPNNFYQSILPESLSPPPKSK